MTHDPLLPSPLAPGYRLDRYELLCPVAQGGMASVWVARLRAKHGFEKLVAIKTILPQLAADVKFQQMFLDEARIASKIDHVNVAHVLDLGDEHGVLYIVMEWVDGDSLSKLQRAVSAAGQSVPHGIALRIVADACAGLHAAHELCDAEGKRLGVVHRDVSPQNILISSGGVVKVIDFGIAKARDRIAGETSTGSLKGKIQFMAPEQAVGRPLDHRADVWAAGAVLYFLLCGEPPYDGPNQFATLHRIASGEPPARLPPSVPEPIAAIAYKALTHDPEKRFASAAEMQRALEGAMIETRTSATTADLAAYVRVHLVSRTEARKKAVDLALRAAADREQLNRALASHADASGGVPQLSLTPSSPGRERSTAPPLRASSPPVPSSLPPPERTTVPEPVGTATTPSSPTLGASSLPTLAPPRRSRRAAVAVAVTGLAAVVGLVAIWRATSGDRGVTNDATAPQPLKAIVATAPPPTPPPVGATASSASSAAASATASASPPASPAARGLEPRKTLQPPPRKAAPTATTKATAPHPAAKPTETIDDGF